MHRSVMEGGGIRTQRSQAVHQGSAAVGDTELAGRHKLGMLHQRQQMPGVPVTGGLALYPL